MSDTGTLGVFLLMAVAFPVSALAAAWLFRRKPRIDEADAKLLPYECGVDTVGPTWGRYRVNYFLYALIFLAFDVEIVFLLPWAVKFAQLGLLAFVEMLVFIGILLAGLWYAWKKEALRWY